MKIREILKYSFCVFTGLSLSILASRAQKIDSLKEVISRARVDTIKIQALNQLGWTMRYSNPDTAIILGVQALKLSEDEANPKHKAISLWNLGVYNNIKGDYNAALDYHSKSLAIREKQNDLKGMASSYNNIGIVYKNLYNYPEAVTYHLKSLKIYETLGSKTNIADTYNNIGVVFDEQSDYPQALEYYHKALKINEELGDQAGLSFSYNNIGNIYYFQSDFSQALDFYFKSLKILEGLGNKLRIAGSYSNIGMIYSSQSDNPKALEYFFKSLEIYKDLGHQEGIANSYNNIGIIYDEQSVFHKAIDYYTKSSEIMEEIGNKATVAISHSNLGALYTTLFDENDSIRKSVSKWAFENRSSLLDTALLYQQSSLALCKDLGLEESMIHSLRGIASIYYLKGQFRKAIEYDNEAVLIAHKVGAKQTEFESHKGLSDTYKKWASEIPDYKTKADYLLKSVDHHDQYVVLRDSVFNEGKQKDIGKLEARHEYEMADIKRKQDELEQARIAFEERSRRNTLQYSASLLAICILFGGVFLLGKLTLPTWAIELSVFLPFLILFEFLLVLTDPYVDSWTGGEPAFNLLVNASLAGLIFPIHSFFEKLLKKRLFKRLANIETALP